MDEKPFLQFDLLDINDHVVPELQKLTKSAFDVESIISAAGELKYVGQIKRVLAAQFNQPDDDFVRYFASRVYEGAITQKVREQFTLLTRKATVQFLGDQINERLKSAMTGNVKPVIPSQDAQKAQQLSKTTGRGRSREGQDRHDRGGDRRLQHHQGHRALRCRREAYRRSRHAELFGVLLDDNNRKPLARLHFNRQQKHLGTFDADKNETRHPIDSLDNIFAHAEALRATAMGYLET